MDKKIFFLSIASIALLFSTSSCKKSKTEVLNKTADTIDSVKVEPQEPEKLTIEPSTDKVSGELGACFDVVKQPYEFRKEGDETILEVKINKNYNNIIFNPEITDTYDNPDEHGYIAVAFGITITDEKGATVFEIVPGTKHVKYAQDALKVVRLNNGKTGTLRFAIKDLSKITNKCKFVITSANEDRCSN